MSVEEDIKRKGIIPQLVRRMTDVENTIRKLLAVGALSRSLYPVVSENSPAQLTAAVDNYVPGDYGALRMSSDASRNITGISGGTAGRFLYIFNVGAQNIVIVHQSGSSTAENRIISPTAANLTLGADDSITLYYDITTARWRVQALAT